MALSAIGLCARALMKIGATPISSFDDGTAEAIVASKLYSATRDGLLSLHPWSFATAHATLARLDRASVGPFSCAFQLPTDFLRALAAGSGNRARGVRYQIVEERLHTNSSSVTLTYLFRAPEAVFPAFFDTALINQLAADFCLPLTESTSRAEYLTRTAQESLRTARLIDSQQDTAPHLVGFPLIDARG